LQLGEPTRAATVGSNEPPAPTFRMHFDADRDGKVDDNWKGLAFWHWGRGKRGAIVLCNNDDDDASGTPDNEDGEVNGGNDRDELAPLVIRKHGSASAPGAWKGTLEVPSSVSRRVRIFESRAGRAAEVIGPTRGARYTFPDLAFTEKELGVEAVFFAGEDGGWDGQVVITFSVADRDALISEQRGLMRVAPWMMPSHVEPADKVFVVNAGRFNKRFRADLAALVARAGCSLQQHAQLQDLWMQDCMEIGHCFVPRHHRPVVMRAKRDRPLKTFPRTLLKADFGYEEPAPLPPGDNTFDSNGNLEVTPPVRSRDGRRFPWGRIYYGAGRPGEEFDSRVRRFLDAQKVQAPIQVDTNWLTVGHVDEVMTFVPAPGPKGFKLLLASPRLAFRILRAAAALGRGSERMLRGRDFYGRRAEVSIDDFLSTGIPGLRLTMGDLQGINDHAIKRLEGIRRQLEADISLDAADLIEVPIIFMPNEMQRAFADALTAGMLNMLVINKHCIVPKPFGPVVGGIDLFEQDLARKLRPLGLTLNFLDDWAEYHVNLGEVHCGTNTLRKPNPAKWKWWELEP
jgi:hypothetical protein